MLLSELISKIPEDTAELVEKAKRDHNGLIRELMRRETGLYLNRQEKKDEWERVENVSVPIEIMPGLPIALQHTIIGDDLWLSSIIGRYRRDLLQLDDSLTRLSQLVEELIRDRRGQEAIGAHREAPIKTQELVKDLLRRLGTTDLVKTILEVDEDVLGVYRYWRRNGNGLSLVGDDSGLGRIELYWGVIGLFAGFLGVSVESLSVVVLIHELAHAYTHLGLDIDRRRWGFQAFFESEKEVKEGLAQYYTHMICNHFKTQKPDWWKAYDELVRRQTDAYRVHLGWTKEFSQEEIRAGMLQVRRRQAGILKEFREAICSIQEKLRNK